MSAESEYLKALLPALNAIPGVFVWRQNAGRGRRYMVIGEKGMPDVVGVVRRRVAFAHGSRWMCDGRAPEVIGDEIVTIGAMLVVECKATKTGKAKDNGQGTLAAQEKFRVLFRAAGAIHIDAAKRDDESMADAVARVVAEVRGYAS